MDQTLTLTLTLDGWTEKGEDLPSFSSPSPSPPPRAGRCTRRCLAGTRGEAEPRSSPCARASAKDATTSPLDGGALTLGRTRAPAKGPAAASAFSSPAALGSPSLQCRALSSEERRGREKRMRLGFLGERPWCCFIRAKHEDSRSISSNGRQSSDRIQPMRASGFPAQA